ncbi:MAG: hypothetical protein ACKVOE_06110 [Rickettsiales bacterium]
MERILHYSPTFSGVNTAETDTVLTLISPPKVTILLVDNGTSGPVSRAAKVARSLMEAGAQVSVLIPNSKLNSTFFDPAIKQVPYNPEHRWRISRQNACWQIAKLRPDVLVVDEYPFVSQQHAHAWENVIRVAKLANPRCVIEGMSNDIPVYPWNEEAKHMPKRAQRLDHILVTGDATLSDYESYVASSALPHVASKIAFVGYMGEASRNASVRGTHKPQHILVYLGGMNLSQLQGRYATLLANIPLLGAELQQAEWKFIMPENHDFRAQKMLDLMKEHLPAEIQDRIVFEPANAAFKDKLQQADMVITGGGLTAVEAAAVAAKPTVILPGFFGDQFQRAKQLAAAYPERVAAIDLPVYVPKPITAERLRFFRIRNEEIPPWQDQVFQWATRDGRCAELREAITRVYATRDIDHPIPSIQLNGAKHIAQHIMSNALSNFRS